MSVKKEVALETTSTEGKLPKGLSMNIKRSYIMLKKIYTRPFKTL